MNPDPNSNGLNRRQFLDRLTKAGISITAACAAGFWFHDSKGPTLSKNDPSNLILPDFSIDASGAKNEHCPRRRQGCHLTDGSKILRWY